MEQQYIEKPTQENVILQILRNAKGGWVDGMIFLRLDSPITQSKARMFGLKEKGYNIEGRFKEGKSWKEYRLIEQPVQQKLI